MRENAWRRGGAAAIEAAALAHFRGEKNVERSTRSELRIDAKGSISVRLAGPKAGAWFDHERETGGYLADGSAGAGRVEGRRPSRGKAKPRLAPDGREAGGPRADPDNTKAGDQLFHSSGSAGRANGHDAPDEDATAEATDKAGDDQRAAEERAERERLLHLRGQFDAGKPLPGTPGEGYLVEHRKLQTPFPPGLGYAPAFRPRPDRAPRPALLAAVTGPEGQFIALHAIRIDPATRGKAKVETPKRSYGPAGEGSIFLGSEAEPSTTLVVAEGVETALTRRVVGPADIHACAGGLRFVAPQKRHRRVEIVADTNSRPQARRLARRYATEHKLAAFVVTVPDALGPKADLNDALQDLGAGAVLAAVEDAERIEPLGGGAGTASPYELDRGSDVEIAQETLRILEDLYGPLVVADGAIWRYDRNRWQPVDDRQVARLVHKADGCVVHTAEGAARFVALGKPRVVSIIDAMMSRAADEDFFRDAPAGINCESGFVAFDERGEPGLLPPARRHRQRHVVKGRWPGAATVEERERSLLARYLREAFAGDEDAEAKRALVAEVLGCAALGHGTRLKQPKVIVAYCTRANTGKSTFLKLARKLLDGAAVCEVPIAKFADDRFVVQLVGKALNTSDELSERAVRGDTFKKVVTGDLTSGRDVYRSAVTFRPTALHLFSTNALPSFKGGIDGGVARRLLALEFAHAVPEEEVIPDLDERIAREEADLLLELAVEGARRVLRSGLFTMPKSSAELMREWLVEVDPVRGWAGERLEVIEGESKIAASVLYADFVRWGERHGFGRDHLPSPNAFGRRLMAAAPDLKKTHSDGIVYTNVRWKPEKAS